MISGQRPFHGRDYGLASSIIDGNRPQRPPWSSIPNHPIWDMAESCWREDPEGRPKLTEILQSLTSACTSPPTEWPSPPMTASTPSVAWSSPRIQPTPLITPAVPPVLPPRPPLPPPRVSVPVLRHPPLPPTLQTQINALSMLRPMAMGIQFIFCDQPVFRWRVAGGGITKQPPRAGRRGGP